MMIIVNRLDDIISGAVNGKQFGVTFDQEKYDAMKKLEAKAATAKSMDEIKTIIADFMPLTEESYKEIVESASPYLSVNKHTNKYYLKYGKVVSSKAIPQALVDKILTSVEKNIDITPLIKCWVRFLRNPNFTDRKAQNFIKYITAPYLNYAIVAKLMKDQGVSNEVATKLATTNQVAITLEGLIVGYKVSKEVITKFALDDDGQTVTKDRYTKSIDEDTGVVTYAEPDFVENRLFMPPVMGTGGDAFSCIGMDSYGTVNNVGHHIRVGCIHALDSWSKVNCDDSTSCKPGLHVGGLDYIKGYQNDGTVTHNVLIDPADIGAIVDIDAGKDGAMRVRKYFVHSSFAGPNKNIYHSSRYAALNDEEYQKYLEEVVNKYQNGQKALETDLKEAVSLV